jgi:putative SOS response-associated peptidase YedK
MCGRFKLQDNPYVRSLLETLGITAQPRYQDDIAPGAQISIIRETPTEGRQLCTATWWLFLNPGSGKPDYKYATFNSRWDKLDDPRSLAYLPFRRSRCIIPASALCEGAGDKKTYHMIELQERAIAFGGLYREYRNRETGETILGASIITLPPCEEWRHIHPKSIPLLLDLEDQPVLDRWLDPSFDQVDFFKPLLEPRIHCVQRITPIDKPSKWNPIGESFLLPGHASG